MSNCSSKVRLKALRSAQNYWRAWGESWAEKRQSQRLKHEHIKAYIQSTHSVNRTGWTPLNTTNRWQQWAAASPQMWWQSRCSILHVKINSRLLKGLDFCSLHHKPHYNTHLFSRKAATPTSKRHTKKEVEGGVWRIKQLQTHNTSFLSNSHLLHALNAPWLQVPLGIASLINANGKRLTSLEEYE